jgi:hypothetical protein
LRLHDDATSNVQKKEATYSFCCGATGGGASWVPIAQPDIDTTNALMLSRLPFSRQVSIRLLQQREMFSPWKHANSPRIYSPASSFDITSLGHKHACKGRDTNAIAKIIPNPVAAQEEELIFRGSVVDFDDRLRAHLKRMHSDLAKDGFQVLPAVQHPSDRHALCN